MSTGESFDETHLCNVQVNVSNGSADVLGEDLDEGALDSVLVDIWTPEGRLTPKQVLKALDDEIAKRWIRVGDWHDAGTRRGEKFIAEVLRRRINE